jgi:hypothetical protein
MKAELGIAAENNPDSKGPVETGAARTRKGKRRSPQGTSPGATVRFFLAKSEGGGTPSLDREFDSESEAIVESFKAGKHFFVISEWKGLADLSKRVPLIRKEAVNNKKTGSL